MVSTHLGGTREAESEPTGPTTPCGGCNEPLWTGADGKPHPSGLCPDCRGKSDPEPPRRCKKHAANPDTEFDDNCGPCANFRKAHARWQIRERRRHHAALSETAHAQAAARAAAIENCRLCDDDGYVHGHPTRVCDHTDRTQTNARGMAALRAEMGWTEPTHDDHGDQPAEDQTHA